MSKPDTTSPYVKMAEWYGVRPELGNFFAQVDWHHRHGFVFSRPDYFVMGRPVVSTAAQVDIVDCEVIFPSGQCDCWFVHAMAGNLARVWDIVPWYLPLVACERRVGERDTDSKVLRFYRMERIRRLCESGFNQFHLVNQ